jgi:hypothetical protein
MARARVFTSRQRHVPRERRANTHAHLAIDVRVAPRQ